MEINELVELLLENRKMALFYVILLLSVVLITMLFLPGIIEKMKALINRRKSPGRISMEWDIVKNNSYTCQNEGFDYFYAGDYAEDNIGYDNPFIDEIQQEFMVSIPDELYNDDLNMNIFKGIIIEYHWEWSLPGTWLFATGFPGVFFHDFGFKQDGVSGKSWGDTRIDVFACGCIG